MVDYYIQRLGFDLERESEREREKEREIERERSLRALVGIFH